MRLSKKGNPIKQRFPKKFTKLSKYNKFLPHCFYTTEEGVVVAAVITVSEFPADVACVG